MLSGMDRRQVGGGILVLVCAVLAGLLPVTYETLAPELKILIWAALGSLGIVGLVVALWPGHNKKRHSKAIPTDEQTTIMARSMVTLAREIFVTVGKARLRRNTGVFYGKDDDEQRTQNEFLYFFGSRVEHARAFLEGRGINTSKIPENWSATIEGAEAAATCIGAAGRQLLLAAGVVDAA